MTKLSVNLNAVAYLRNRRDLPWPSVVELGRAALEAGAHGLTVHPRPDERHIRRSDLSPLSALVAEFSDREFNMEGYPTDEFIALCREHRPHQVTLVPDDPSQSTSDHGWDFEGKGAYLKPIVTALEADGFRLSLFADPDPLTIHRAADTGASRVEVYTGPYGGSFHDQAKEAVELEHLAKSAKIAFDGGLGVNAGHDLTVENLAKLSDRVPTLDEVSIGHALTAEALKHGMSQAVTRFLSVLGTE